jgi:hypothetical protein
MADLQKRLTLALLPITTPAAEPGLYKANESGNINTIIRSIHVNNETATIATFTLSIVAASASDAVGKRLFTALSVPANGQFDWSGFLVMNPNEWLAGFSGTASALTIIISGVVIT